MLNTSPLISVVMLGDTTDVVIAESIESILRQTYTHLELLIVHTNSCASSRRLIADWCSRDSRVRQIIAPEDQSFFNLGIAEAGGDYISFIDGKDLWPDQKLEWQLDAMVSARATVALGHVQRFWTDADGETYWGSVSLVPMLPTHYLSQVLMVKSEQMLNMQTALISRHLLAKDHFFAKLLCPISGWDAWLRLAASNKFVHIDRELLFSRQYMDVCEDAAQIKQRLREELLVINRHSTFGVAGWYLKHEAKRVRYETAFIQLLDVGKTRLALSLCSKAFWESSLFWRVSGWQVFFRILRQLF